ncbi:MAG: hypothetical protein HY868_22245 [Chloroflexi bacterium]|nr:hypothetical protein [Chloroflexota bacterium]
MWNQIVAVLAILIALTYVVEQILTRVFHIRLPRRRGNLGRDLAPLLAFTGILLLVLSSVDAYRRAAIESLLLGLGLGIFISLVLLAAGAFQANVAPRGVIGIVRTYGIALALAVIGISLAVRVIGPTAQVFVEGTASMLVMGLGFVLFMRAREEPRAANKS